MPEIDCKESSNIHWARWNNETEVLELDFKNAAGVKESSYRYRRFSGEEWDRLNAAESKGRHFAYVIRPLYAKGGARFGLCEKIQPTKVAEECERCRGAKQIVISAAEGISSVALNSGATVEAIDCPACGGTGKRK
jgi:hypothetical protein